MRYRSQILETEDYLSLECTGFCGDCPVSQTCYELDGYYEGEDVIEDIPTEQVELVDEVNDWFWEDEAEAENWQ